MNLTFWIVTACCASYLLGLLTNPIPRMVYRAGFDRGVKLTIKEVNKIISEIKEATDV